MVNKRAACFFTSGYTEAGELQGFLKRINPNIDFRQCFPNKAKKRKGEEKSLISSGATGSDLIERVIQILKQHSEYKELYDYIIIEDDLDLRFKGKSADEITDYEKELAERIIKESEINLPILFLYASPEIEAWFISDWDNCFTQVYCDKTVVPDLNKSEISLFLIRLKKEIEKLCSDVESIELYGYDMDEYTKLSDRLISFFEPNYIRNVIMKMSDDESEASDSCKKVCSSRYIFYSKKIHGSRMLRSADPYEVQKNCNIFFRKSYNDIKALQ